jgi:transposase
VDLAKSVFAIAVSSRPGHVDRQLRLTRSRFVEFMAQQPPAVVVLEACGSAHFWARQLRAFGHTPVPLPAPHVRPYVRRNKTDAADALALLEAYRDERLRPVPVKTVEQQALAALHRMRSAWLATTARLNALRGILRELGVTIPVGARHVLPRLRLEHPDRLRAWALRLERTVGHNKAAVALANKLARIAWALDTRQCDFAPVVLDRPA